MKMRNDLKGRRFGRLVAFEDTKLPSGHYGFNCLCDCGNVKAVARGALETGRVVSCGCAKAERLARGNLIHGHNRKGGLSTPTRGSWRAMKERCLNPNHKYYCNYGGRGISVCERWLKFENFLEDMGERPAGKTLDKVDNNGMYEKSNCRWATWAEQGRNRRPRSRPKSQLT